MISGRRRLTLSFSIEADSPEECEDKAFQTIKQLRSILEGTKDPILAWTDPYRRIL